MLYTVQFLLETVRNMTIRTVSTFSIKLESNLLHASNKEKKAWLILKVFKNFAHMRLHPIDKIAKVLNCAYANDNVPKDYHRNRLVQ